MPRWRNSSRKPEHPDEVRMTLGEHLEELRSRLIRAIIAVFLGAILCFAFSDYIIGYLCWPVLGVLEAQGYDADLVMLTPAEGFVTDVKVSLIVGVILSAPYSLSQIWGFIAAGLYPHERKWVHRFVPVSIALFFVGALFLLTVAAPLLLDFLLGYRTEMPNISRFMPDVLLPDRPKPLEAGRSLEAWPVSPTSNGIDSPQPDHDVWPSIPAFVNDPKDSPEGVPWLNLTEREIHVLYGNQVYKFGKLETVEKRQRLKPTIRIAEYIMFVLQLAAAFGIGFQVPVVVAFLATIGIATSQQMAELRRYVWLGMAMAAAILTPPDVSSMLFLLVPMALLYEVGLIAARFLERERAAAE